MDYWMRYGIAMHAANSFVDRRIRPAMEKNGIRRSYGPVLLFVKMNPGCSLKDIA